MTKRSGGDLGKQRDRNRSFYPKGIFMPMIPQLTKQPSISFILINSLAPLFEVSTG